MWFSDSTVQVNLSHVNAELEQSSMISVNNKLEGGSKCSLNIFSADYILVSDAFQQFGSRVETKHEISRKGAHKEASVERYLTVST